MANSSLDSFRALSPEDQSRVATSLKELGYEYSPEDLASYHDSSGGRTRALDKDDWLAFTYLALVANESSESSLGAI